MLNSVTLMGRLVADPELKTTQNGTSVVSFRLAVERNYAPQGQERPRAGRGKTGRAGKRRDCKRGKRVVGGCK